MPSGQPYWTAALPAVTRAQNFPTKPIRLVVLFPSGGSTDLVGRVLSAKRVEAFNQQVIVENRSCASGMIGNEFVAPPDGYMLTMGTIGAMLVVISRFKNVPYDSTRGEPGCACAPSIKARAAPPA